MSIAIQKPHYLHTIGVQLFFNDYLRSWIFRLLLVCCTFNIGWAGLACLSNPCVFGVCIDDLNSTYSCYCIDGYTGTNCQTNWDECWSSPCQNDGTCIDGVAAYNCSCTDGFVGLNCEENLNECLSNPCQNGGSCYDRDNSYVCVCQLGFLGSNCDVDVAVCATGDERCYNGGECIEGVGLEFSCNCVDGYEGEHCDVEIDECESAPCANGAICIDKLASYQCACAAGYTGENCEEEIMVCNDSPCQNNALCLMELGTPVCYCVPDFHGEKCEHQYDECELMSPRCVNGGTCIDGIDEYSCSCPPQITGMSCECLMLEDNELDCNYTAEFTSIMSTTSELASYTTLPTVQESSSTVSPDATTEMATEGNSIIETYETTTGLDSTVELTTSISLTSEIDLTTAKLVTSTMETTSDVTQLFEASSSPDTTKPENVSSVAPETTLTNSVTTDVTYKSTTDYNEILDDTTLSNSFFTDYPTVKTSTESTVLVDKTDRPTVDTQQSTVTTETTTEYVMPTTIEVEKNVSTTKPTACAKACQNGGTCLSTPEGAKCKCQLHYEGSLCETPVSIKNAAFNGNSFISHMIHPSSSQKVFSRKRPFNIQVEINARTRASDGLILLATAQSARGNYYMALFLHKGLLQFQFSCGQQTMLLSELEMPVNTGDDIFIQAELDFIHNYTHCNAFLRVNDTLAMSGYQPTWINLLPLNIRYEQNIENSWLHLGGTPQAPVSLVNNLVGKPGFTGCMQSLKINGQSLNMYSDAVDTVGITECGSLTCLSNPCQNRGICVERIVNSMESNEIQDIWHCKCPPGFRGKRCEISVCENNPCQYGSTCVLFPGSGYLCLCPYGKHGHFCEHNLEIAQPHFSGSVNGLASYVAYPVQLPLDYSMELSLNILPTTMSQISLVAFIGQSSFHDDKSDHMAISFIQGYVMLTWNLGSGPRRIFTEKPLEFKENAARTSININVGRLGRRAWLSVDGKYNVSGRSPGSLTKMNVEPIVYLGGHKMSNFSSLPHDLPLHMGFQGCIFDVHFKAGMVVIPLQETRGVQGRGVGQCGTKECHRHACQNGGACLNHGSTFSCICQEGFYGPLCAQKINPCDEGNNKCFTGSVCVVLVNGYECDCPLGRTGQYCESVLTSLSDVGLSGRRSYLEIFHPGDLDNAMSENEIDYQNYKMFVLTNANANDSQKTSLLSNVTLPHSPHSRRQMLMATLSNAIRRVQYFSVEFQIKPLAEKGLLLFYGPFKSNTGFISLSLQGGVVEFRILTTDQHINIVRSVRMLAIGEWHKVKASQSGRRISLWVEGTASAALASTSDVFIRNDSHIFLGGVPDLSELPGLSISGFPMPMRGCLRHLSVNGVRVVLNESNIHASRNLYDCDGTPCGGDTCESEGQCWLDTSFQPHCKCTEVAKGSHCEFKESCKYINCKNNGKCLLTGECSCPNGYGGFHCEIVTSRSSKPSFRGNSWLMVQPKRIPVKEKRNGPVIYNSRIKNEFKVSLNFSTISMDGLLLWAQNENGYVGLGIQNGQMKFASNLLNGSGNDFEMPNGGFVADGGWHDVQLEINEKSVTFAVDDRPIFTENQKLTKMRPFIAEEFFDFEKHPFFIGGLPNNQTLQRQTKNIFKKPFVGCLENINIGTEDLNDFSSYDGENIGSCDFDDFSYLQHMGRIKLMSK